MSNPDLQKAVVIGGLAIDAARRTVRRSGEELAITSVEFDLLWMLMDQAGCMVKREALFSQVLGRRFSVFDRSVDAHISRLRKKLDQLRGRNRIKTVRTVGCLFCLPQSKNQPGISNSTLE